MLRKLGEVRGIVANDRDVLLYLANYAAIRLHPWSSRVESYPKTFGATGIHVYSPVVVCSITYWDATVFRGAITKITAERWCVTFRLGTGGRPARAGRLVHPFPKVSLATAEVATAPVPGRAGTRSDSRLRSASRTVCS